MHKWLILFSFISLSAFAKNKDYSFSISNSTTSNLKMNSTAEHYSSTSLSFGARYKNYSASLAANKTLVGEMKLNIGNLVLGMSYPTKLELAGWKLGFSSKAILPTSKSARKISFLRLGSRHSASASRSVEVLGKNIYLSMFTSVGINFHQYKTNLNGGSNHQQTYTVGGSFNLPLIKKVNLGVSGSTTKLITYAGNDTDTYSLSQTLSTSYKKVGITLGHYLGGSLLSPNGTDLGVRLFDNERSNIFLDFSYSF